MRNRRLPESAAATLRAYLACFCPRDLRWRGSSVEIRSHPEDPSRSMPVAKGAFFHFQSRRSFYAAVRTRYESRDHLPLTSLVHASRVPDPGKSGGNAILLREAAVFFSSVCHCVGFRKSITMAMVSDDKSRDSSSRPFSCSDFLRGYKRIDINWTVSRASHCWQRSCSGEKLRIIIFPANIYFIQTKYARQSSLHKCSRKRCQRSHTYFSSL